MSKKHIISIGYRHYACDSIAQATQSIAILSKLIKVTRKAPDIHCDRWTWTSDNDGTTEDISLEMNQEFSDPVAKAKPKKPLSLPAPKRGSIRCICDKSDVSPRTSCAHCGRPFSESHSRTH